MSISVRKSRSFSMRSSTPRSPSPLSPPARRSSHVTACISMVFALALTATADAAPKPRGWTAAQARTALVTTPRIVAVRAFTDRTSRYLVELEQIRSIQPFGPRNANGYQRFVIGNVNPITGYFPASAPERPWVSFCLVVTGPVRTSHPWSGFTITGWEPAFGVHPVTGKATWGCARKALALRSTGGPQR